MILVLKKKLKKIKWKDTFPFFFIQEFVETNSSLFGNWPNKFQFEIVI